MIDICPGFASSSATPPRVPDQLLPRGDRFLVDSTAQYERTPANLEQLDIAALAEGCGE